MVATSTASGKSLCYTIPILQALAQVGVVPGSASLARMLLDTVQT